MSFIIKGVFTRTWSRSLVKYTCGGFAVISARRASSETPSLSSLSSCSAIGRETKSCRLRHSRISVFVDCICTRSAITASFLVFVSRSACDPSCEPLPCSRLKGMGACALILTQVPSARKAGVNLAFRSWSLAAIPFSSSSSGCPMASSILLAFPIKAAAQVATATRLEDLFSREDTAEIKYLMKRARRTGLASRQLEMQTERQTMHLAVTVSALEEKLTSGFVIVLEDTSELLRAQKAAAWHEVARRVAH